MLAQLLFIKIMMNIEKQFFEIKDKWFSKDTDKHFAMLVSIILDDIYIYFHKAAVELGYDNNPLTSALSKNVSKEQQELLFKITERYIKLRAFE